MPLDRGGAQVASQQSPIVRRGKVKNTLAFSGLQATTGRLAHRHGGTSIPQARDHRMVMSCRSPAMLLAQSGKSQGFGDGVPKGSRSTLKPDEPTFSGTMYGYALTAPSRWHCSIHR